MTKRFSSLILAAVIGLLIVAIGLGFLSGLDNPVSWVLICVLLLIPFIYNKKNTSNELQWKEDYSVGIKVLDDDHKKLINLLNQFKTAYDYHTSDDFEQQALKSLIDYTKFHFKREEELLQLHNYPDYEEHKKQHELMIAEVESFIDKYNQQGHEALDEVSDFLTAWLVNHINGTDKQYSGFLNGKGVL